MIAFGDSTDVGRRMGMNLTILSLGALAGPPISGAISKSTGGYAAVGIYAGPFSFSSFSLACRGSRVGDLVLTVPRRFLFCLRVGSSVMVAVCLLVLSRYFILRRWIGKT